MVVGVSALAQLDPVLQIYTWYSGAGAMGVIWMMTLTSVAVVAFSRTQRGAGSGFSAPSTPVVVSAALGGIGLFLVFGISVWNLPMLVGSVLSGFVWGGILVVTFVAGMLLPQRVGSATPVGSA